MYHIFQLILNLPVLYLFQIKFDNKVVKKKKIWSLNELIMVDGKTSSQVINILPIYFNHKYVLIIIFL